MDSKLLSALSNETRLKIITCLKDKPKNVTQLISTCGLSQSAVSQHLAKLREANLVAVTKRGKEVYYAPKSSTLLEIAKLIEKLQKEVVN